jgi:uncharacterized membrane-anchored protein
MPKKLLQRPSKLPEVVASFWVIKILTTGMGEAASDFLVRTFGPFIAVAGGFLIFAAALTAHFVSKRFSKWLYWLAVAMVSVFGTMAADILHIGLGVPYLVSTVFFAVVLILTFAVWKLVEGSFAMSSITSARSEIFYWVTVLTTFALGTAAGDMTARTLNLGYLNSGLLFGVCFALPLIVYLVKQSPIMFWLAYIATRPFGASFADWIGADGSHGGLGFGFGNIALVLTVAMVVVIASTKSAAGVRVAS